MASPALPIFPLPLVLFPGVRLPLHIFEPRYRHMLADCLAGDRRFGIVFLPVGLDERALPSGHVGCVASIEASHALPDGRSNIVVSGTDRFSLESFEAPPKPYRVARVVAFGDTEESGAELETFAVRVRRGFSRVGGAARAIADDGSPLPTLSDDPALLSFQIASVVDLDLPARQRLLTSRSPLGRLRELDDLLSAAADPLERRADAHRRAKHNGRDRTTSS